jgi:hypothetical protein
MGKRSTIEQIDRPSKRWLLSRPYSAERHRALLEYHRTGCILRWQVVCLAVVLVGVVGLNIWRDIRNIRTEEDAIIYSVICFTVLLAAFSTFPNYPKRPL